jgi:hypothetical protein
MRTRTTTVSLGLSVLASLMAFSDLLAQPPQAVMLSSPALYSRFARENELGAEDLARLTGESESPESLPAAPDQANADWNGLPQNETSIALHPTIRGSWVIGANDSGIGVPVGTGVYTSERVNYFPPFPFLAARGGSGSELLLEPPSATGDPSVAYGFSRAAGGLPSGLPVVYLASLGFSSTFCENGVFLYRSLDNGKTWTRPIVPTLLPPSGRYTVVYYDSAQNCSVFHDKEWIAVDNTNGPHRGRVYVTWTQFQFAGPVWVQSPIMMAYSDDNGRTFSPPIPISGFNAALCGVQNFGPQGFCDQDSGSIPVVAPDGTLVVAFRNSNGSADFRGQYLVVRVNPDTFAIQGPFKAAALFDGLNDYPINSAGRQTLCNSNFRVLPWGNLAVSSNGILYIAFFDNRRHQGEFPFPTFVGNRASGYACPTGKSTDTDVFLTKSIDGGRTWSAPVRVNQDNAGNNRDQWYPWVAVAPNGRVDVVFYDRRADSANKLSRTFLARSSDGGATWIDMEVSTFASNFDNAFFGSGSFIGDYNGLAIDPDGKSYPVWTGVAPLKMDSDVYFAAVAP